MAKRKIPMAPLATVSSDERLCGQWPDGPILVLLCAVLAERILIEQTYAAGGRVELSWDQNGPRVHCWVSHHVELIA